jgi:hypothetical protein
VILHHLTVTIQFRVVIFLFAFGLRFEYKLVLWVFAFLQVLYLYRRYFFSMATIVNTVLDIVNERVFPSAVHGYEHWNNPPYNPTLTDRLQFNYPLPLDLPAPPPTDGFTAVILAYDRIEMLFQVIKSVSKAPSLAKVSSSYILLAHTVKVVKKTFLKSFTVFDLWSVVILNCCGPKEFVAQ